MLRKKILLLIQKNVTADFEINIRNAILSITYLSFN